MKPSGRNSLGLAVALLAVFGFAGCSKANQASPASTEQNPSSPAPSFTQQPQGGEQAQGQAQQFPSPRMPQAPQEPARPPRVTVPSGTELHVVLDEGLSSATAQSGQAFDATLIEPVVVHGKAVIPRDARVKGHVAAVKASGRLRGVASLSLTLDSVEVAGRSYDIQSSTVTRSGSSHKKRDIVAIGGGSALGAIIGGIAGGGKGAAIGALAGGGAGTAGAAMTGKKNIAVPAEARLVFSLTAPVDIAPSA